MPIHSLPQTIGVLALIVIGANYAGRLAMMARLPAVIGELGLGVILGLIPDLRAFCSESDALTFMGELGVMLLLFEVGLESSIAEMRQVGGSAIRIAVVGIAASTLLGIMASWAFSAASSALGHFFIGAALAATSVGLTVRVLRDAGQIKSPEARVILGAAVLDDILALVLLGVLSAFAASTRQEVFGVTQGIFVVARALAFIAGALLVGSFVLPFIRAHAERFLGRGNFVVSSLGICLSYAFAAHLLGLAPAIGAFFAGLVVRPYPAIVGRIDESMKSAIEPLLSVFVPLFFVMVGLKLDIFVFASSRVLGLTVVLCLVAVAGKILAGRAAAPSVNRLLVGIGMIPRGEVTLIFAAIGARQVWHGESLLSPEAFAAVVAVAALTSLISPVWLAYLLRKVPSTKEMSIP